MLRDDMVVSQNDESARDSSPYSPGEARRNQAQAYHSSATVDIIANNRATGTEDHRGQHDGSPAHRTVLVCDPTICLACEPVRSENASLQSQITALNDQLNNE